MSTVRDNWARLVEAVLDREELRQIALAPSFNSSISDGSSSRFNFDSTLQDLSVASIIASKAIDFAAPSSPSVPTYCYAQPIAFKELKKATKNFRRDYVLGRGEFGRVYKGWIHERTLTAAKPGSGIAVAVKKCANYSMNFRLEWLAEIRYLSQLHHPNVVELIGYSCEEDNLLLVYEFMPNRSLNHHLFRGSQSLSWATRINVAIGAATGLSFLHDLEKPVIHIGFHNSDILLDGEFNAKVSDFGLAEDGPTGDMIHVTNLVKGRCGHIAPEYLTKGHLTAKCDVFAFGGVLLELLSGGRIFDLRRTVEEQDSGGHVSDLIIAGEEQDPVEWTKTYLHNKEKLFQMMDTKLEGRYPQNGANAALTLAFQCLNTNPELRPRMAEVLVALQQL